MPGNDGWPAAIPASRTLYWQSQTRNNPRFEFGWIDAQGGHQTANHRNDQWPFLLRLSKCPLGSC